MPRSLEYLFSEIAKHKKGIPVSGRTARQSQIGETEECTFKVNVSYLEIYNETIYDLLDSSQANLKIREDKNNKRVYVEGITETEVNTVRDVLGMMLLKFKFFRFD